MSFRKKTDRSNPIKISRDGDPQTSAPKAPPLPALASRGFLNEIVSSIGRVVTSRKFWQAALLAAIGTGAGVFFKGGWDKCCADKPIIIPIAVVSGQEFVKQAAVNLDVPGIPSKQTDDFGRADFEISSVFRGKSGHVHVWKDGYISPRERDYPIVIQTRDWKEPFSVLIAKVPPPPPPPLAPAPVREKLTRVYRSGLLASGAGIAWSQWYPLCSNQDVPEGYVIESESFRLVGDRSCGGWGQCNEESRDTHRVCWRFAMQGHSEWGANIFAPGSGNGVGYSEGILTVVWAPQ